MHTVQDYVEGLVYRLAERSRLTDRRLEIIVVNNPTINAFAIPGVSWVFIAAC